MPRRADSPAHHAENIEDALRLLGGREGSGPAVLVDGAIRHSLDEALPRTTPLGKVLDRFMAAGIHTGFGDDWVRIGGVKQYADGSISERTAWLSQPYIGIPNNYTGLQLTTREKLYEVGNKAHAAGWQLATHANGDLAIDRILGVYEQIQKESPQSEAGQMASAKLQELKQ